MFNWTKEDEQAMREGGAIQRGFHIQRPGGHFTSSKAYIRTVQRETTTNLLTLLNVIDGKAHGKREKSQHT